MELNIYNVERDLQNAINKIKNSDITERNKELIFKFKRHCTVNNLGKGKTTMYLWYLKNIALSFNKDFEKITKEDVKKYIENLQESKYKTLTKISYKSVLKRFFKWLKGKDIEYPKEVSWINTTVKRNERRLPNEGDLITEEDIKKLIGSAENLRDKAFISVLYESGCRISEIGNIKIQDLKFDEYGILINVSGKTGSRAIRLISSTSLLSSWLNIHPFKENRDSPIWICLRKHKNKSLKYTGIHSMLQNLFKKAGINKRFNPHLFRHSRATFLANHLTEFQMNQYFGWVQGSGMPSTYVHLSGKNVDGAILELNGVKIDKNKIKESSLKPKKCPRCDRVNGFSDKYCSKCACILDIETAMALEEDRKFDYEFINGLMDKTEFWIALIKKLKDMGISKDIILDSIK